MLLAFVAACLPQMCVSQVVLSRDAAEVPITQALAVDAKASWSRRLINIDPIVQRVVDGQLAHVGAPVPKAGDALFAGQADSPVWEAITAEDGAFTQAGTRYLFTTITSERERVMVLEASGHGVAYVNGEPRAGDPYGFGYVHVPVLMREGVNTLLIASAGRGAVKARLRAPERMVEINTADITAPDVLDEGVSVYWMGVPVMNNTRVAQRVKVSVDAKNRSLEELTRYWGHFPKLVTEIVIPPMSVAKVPVPFDGTYDADGSLDARVFAESEGETSQATIALTSKAATATHKRTFVSGVDGSVQYYSVVPAVKDAFAEVPPEAPGLVLSLHGASVEATNQAASYSAKSDFVIVCPTNRRPFGFDWEDWGRVDALEVLNVSRRILGTNPRRQYVTGHSMGGHGTWQMATLFPDLFAAAAPSAGWLSFDTYAEAGGMPRENAAKLRAGMHPSSWTMDRIGNLRGMGMYMVHGTADDNVPASEAYRGGARMALLNMPYGMHMEPAAGHWWDNDEPGAACVDWAPIFEMFREHELPARGSGEAFELRGRRMRAPIDARAMPVGSFKRAFDRNFVLVYGTAGDDAADAWALAKARFDAETWWYRGNGFAQVLADTAVTGADVAGRNVIVYGHADERVFSAFASGNPKVDAAVARDAQRASESPASGASLQLFGASVGGKHLDGKALRGEEQPHIAVITGDSLRAMRALDRLPIFSSGVMIPERLRMEPDVWTRGGAAVVERSDVRGK